MIIVPRKVLGYLREKDRRYVYLIVVRLLILRIFVPRYVYLIESFIREGRVLSFLPQCGNLGHFRKFVKVPKYRTKRKQILII